MATFTTLSLTADDPWALPEALAVYNNPLAIAEGASGAPRIKFAAMDAWFSSVGEVGTYALLYRVSTAASAAGTLVAGSALRYGSANGDNSGTPSGTWKLMGYLANASGGSTVSLFMRVA